MFTWIKFWYFANLWLDREARSTGKSITTCLEKEKLQLHGEKWASTLATSFKKFFFNEWQQNSDLGVVSDKITANHNLTNQRYNTSQNVSQNFDSALNNLKWKMILIL